MGCLLASAWFLRKNGLMEERGILGGPTASSPLVSSAEGAELDGGVIGAAALSGNSAGALTTSGNDLSAGALGAVAEDAIALDGTAVKDLGTAVGPAFDRMGMISYKVQSGDNLSRIASYFGISVNTIVSANPGIRANVLQVGQTLNILPTTGVVYHAQGGDTLESISNAFGVQQDEILQFNHAVNFASLEPGAAVIIPGGKNTNAIAAQNGLANYNGEFIMPTDGYNWGILHHYNAVDIANSCGTPVVAAAEGLVVPDDNIPDIQDGWNEGYGNFVLIEHPFGNNVMTRYAHLEKITVQIGDYVQQGQQIGLMGQTGDATGCHLHFEVIGAQNPFAKD